MVMDGATVLNETKPVRGEESCQFYRPQQHRGLLNIHENICSEIVITILYMKICFK
jgi:hypothetical protein